jgi:PLP dependent protein
MNSNPEISQIRQQVNSHQATLIAVSKTHPIESIQSLYEDGLRHFGENRVQELVQKAEALPKDIKWHQIGHLQTNKVKDIVPFVHLIHTVDSLKLLLEIEKQAAKVNRIVPILFQYHVASEKSKFGIPPSDDKWIYDLDFPADCPHIEPRGVMGMATFTENTDQIRAEFQTLKGIFSRLKDDVFSDQPHFKEISMGMSSDYQIALEEGSTLVRIGSLIFGQRPYEL